VLHTAVIHNQHDKVDRFSTELQSPTPPRNGDRSRRAPTGTGAAGRDALAVTGSDNETTLNHRRHNRHAFRLFKNLLWNAFVGRTHDLVEHVGSGIDTLYLF